MVASVATVISASEAETSSGSALHTRNCRPMGVSGSSHASATCISHTAQTLCFDCCCHSFLQCPTPPSKYTHSRFLHKVQLLGPAGSSCSVAESQKLNLFRKESSVVAFDARFVRHEVVYSMDKRGRLQESATCFHQQHRTQCSRRAQALQVPDDTCKSRFASLSAEHA